MRVTEAPGYTEARDAISQDWTRRLDAWGMLPLLVPNGLAEPAAYLDAMAPDLLVLTGGDDIGTTPDRDKTETALLDHALEHALPVLGVCRGMQVINTHLGGGLENIEDHAARRHAVSFAEPFAGLYGDTAEVNSYHGLCIPGAGLAEGLSAAATDQDGNIEAFLHNQNAVAGVMWHPERDAVLDGDRCLLERLLSNGAAWI